MSRKVKDDGRTTRWDAHRDQRRAELVLAAVAGDRPARPRRRRSPTSPREAGVSKPVLYRYFADKDELHAAVGQWGANEVLSRMIPALTSDAPMRERIANATDAYLATLEEHPQVFLLLVRHRGGGRPGRRQGRDRCRVRAVPRRHPARPRHRRRRRRAVVARPGRARPVHRRVVARAAHHVPRRGRAVPLRVRLARARRRRHRPRRTLSAVDHPSVTAPPAIRAASPRGIHRLPM